MDPFVAEIRMMGFNFAPVGWAQCNGQILPISQNTALFSLLGTTYGGNGTSNFALPNLQGRVPLQQGQGPGLSLYDLGQVGGEQTVTLLQSQAPSHSHGALGAANDGVSSPVGQNWGSAAKGHGSLYAPYSSGAQTQMAAGAIGSTGGNAPHNNLPPYITLNYCIALQGVYPPRS